MLIGEGLFYGGSVRTKNRLSFEFSCYINTAVITIQWYLFGYSLSYSSEGSFIGDFRNLNLFFS
jgi:ammonium transporter, Amt family